MQLLAPINVRSEQLVSADGGGVSFPVGDYPSVALSGTIRQVFGDVESGVVEYKCQMIDGPYKGASFPMTFNVYNKNPESAGIGRRQLASFGACVGVFDITDTDALLNKPFLSCWRPRKDKPDINQVTGCKDVNGNDPLHAGRGPQPGQPAPAAGNAQGQGAWGAQPAAQQPAHVAAPAPGFGPAAAPAGFGPAAAQQQAPAPQQQPAAGGPAWGGGPATQPAQQAAAPAAWGQQAGGQPAAGGAGPAWAQGR